MQFKKAPLIELIAEFRWVVGGSSAPATTPGQILSPIPVAESGRYEPFFSAFSRDIASHGYVRTERLIPLGWPFPFQTPVLRFKHADFEKGKSTLYQLGAGIFSAHAVPPYQNWEEFKPVISAGLSVLMNNRPADEHTSKFTTVVLRYLDRFTSDFAGGLLPRDFIEQVFRIRIDLPTALKEEAFDERVIDPTLLLKIPLKSGLMMTLGVNPQTQPPGSGIVLDTTVSSQSSVQFELEEAMGMLEDAHNSIRHVFTGLTEPIYNKMEPMP